MPSEASSIHAGADVIKPFYQKKGFKYLWLFFTIILLFLSLLPIAVKHVILYVLDGQGFKTATLDDVDINLFSGEFGLTGFVASVDGQQRASIDAVYINLSMMSLLQKRIHIEQLNIDKVELDVAADADKQWQIAAYALPQNNEVDDAPMQTDVSAKPWGIAIDNMMVSSLTSNISSPKISTIVRLEKLNLSKLASWRPEQNTSLKLALFVDHAPVHINAQLRPFAETPSINLELDLESLPLSLAKHYAADAGVEALSGAISASLKLAATAGDVIALDSDVVVELSDLVLQQGPYKINNDNAKLVARVSYNTPVDESHGITANAKLDFQSFMLRDTQAKVKLAAFDQLAITGIEISEALHAEIEQAELMNVQLLSTPQAKMLSLKSVVLDALEFDGKDTIGINTLKVKGLDADIKLLANGELEVAHLLKTNHAADTSHDENKTKENTPTQTMRIKMQHVQIGEGSRIKFEDQTVSPVFSADVSPFSVDVRDIDNGAIEQGMKLVLDADINQYQKLSLKAELRPFAAKLNADANITLRALELPPLSPYIETNAGYYLRRGQLDTDVHLLVVDDQLNSKINSNIKKLIVEEGSATKAQSLSEQLSMPLDAALDLLRDGEDNIKLEVTIDGDINDPQLDASKVINRALANATKKAITSYLSYMLQPWGALLTVVEIAGKATATRFEALSYAPLNVELNAEQQQYLGKIAALLDERPKLSLNICGMVSEQDRAALLKQAQQAVAEAAQSTDKAEPAAEVAPIEIDNQQLLALAQQRGQHARAHLLDIGISAERVFSCQPDMNTVAEGAPSVELFL